jgi:plastocyanin
MYLSGKPLWYWLLSAAAAAPILSPAQDGKELPRVEVHLRIELPQQRGRTHEPPAVLWLKPLAGDPTLEVPRNGHYTLLQKNRTFTPHLLVVPTGSVVYFPNADPFYHNVFSLFNGKRFDLGLYEAGTTREEVFSREGISYIFCNIHPEMSAVIVAVNTPFYAVADAGGGFRIRDVLPGEYEMHLWIEGLTEQSLARFTRRVEIASGGGDLGVLDPSSAQKQPPGHLNKFGQPYDRDARPTY